MKKKKSKKVKNLSEAPPLTPEIMSNNSSICVECLSPIEILSINEDNSYIEFRCLEDNNKDIITISIKEFLEEKEKYCQKIIDEEKCKLHSSYDNNYISYCFDCKIHLCKECLKSRIHINHNKNYLIEIQPTQDELNLIEEVTKDYKICIDNLKKEKIITINELNDLLDNNKKNEINKLKKKIEINESKQNIELLINKNEFLNDIQEIKKKYENEIALRKKKYIIENNAISNKYKLINEKDFIITKLNIEKLNKKYDEDIYNLPYDRKISNMDHIIKINDIIYNSYNNSNNNYYNALNINNLLLFFCNNEYIKNKIMKKVLNNNYENIVELILTKKNEDINFNLKIENERKRDLNEIIKEANEKNEQKINDLIEENKQSINELNEKYENILNDMKEENEQKLNDLKEENIQAIKEIELINEKKINKIKKENAQKIKEIKDEEGKITNILIKEVFQYNY